MSGLSPLGSPAHHDPIDPATLGPAAAPTTADPSTTSQPDAAAPARTATSSVADLWASLGAAASAAATAEPGNLDTTGAHRPVALGANHRFTAEPGVEAEAPTQVGAGLYAAATLIDDTKGNLFDRIGLDAAGSKATLDGLAADLGTVRPGMPAPADMTDLQALQLRSSGTTVLLELMTASQTPEDVKREAFALYSGALVEETNPLLKDAMALHLGRLRGSLPADLGPAIDQIQTTLAPEQPPYDAWFKDGNDTVKIDWVTMEHGVEINKKQLLKGGFKLKEESGGHTIFEKTVEKNGVTTKFEVDMHLLRNDMYDKVGADDAQMHVYTGHSDWGRNMRSSLEHASVGNGGENKLVLTDLCVGKGEMQMFQDKFPNADLVTTYNSSYFYPDSDSEGSLAFLKTVDGIASRRGYRHMSEEIRRDNPFAWNHQREGIDNNFIFPTDVDTRRRVLDQDHDGQADVFDRLVDFNTFSVAEDTAREFQPVETGRPADELVGTKVHFAAETINRLVLYSGIFKDQNSTGKVLPNGYFDPKPGETALFRFEETKLDGSDAIVMQMSSQYAHMSEEALRMAACFEYNRFVAETDPSVRLEGDDVILSGLVLAEHSLNTDAGRRDSTVWGEFLKAYNLPQISKWEVNSAKQVDEHAYSGSRESLPALREKLDPDTLAALSAPGAGRHE